jgi:hypothetical protein
MLLNCARIIGFLLLSASVGACGAQNPGPPLTSGADATADMATGAADAPATTADSQDASDAPAPDAAPAIDASAPVDATPGKSTPWGPIRGECGVVAAELLVATPSFHVDTWHFDQAGPFDPKPLRAGAMQRYAGPNAGGSSKCSETMSMQLLYECDGALTAKTETQVVYDGPGPITDWLADIGGLRVGVSVSRAYKGPKIDVFTLADAQALLEKKLAGVNASTAHISAQDKWVKQILHIWTLHPEWAELLRQAWQDLDAKLKADTVVLITVEEGSTDVVADTCEAP